MVLITLISCNSNKKENKISNHQVDTLPNTSTEVVYDNSRKNLKFAIADTIKKSNSYFFSNPDSKDLFLLIIEPGEIKNSKAKLQIITADNKIIYTQSFDAFYFLREIDEPETTPAGSQEDREKYIEKYRNSLTQKQYQAYFNTSIANFFGEISPIENNKDENFQEFEEDSTDKDFLNEVLADETIKLISITCFGCDEGGAIIGYSKKQNKVVTLLEHD
ncbi:hypothetical protein SAMN05444397_102339 [Flavobacterium aquidurense]|uniref:hypothetical protein n=1 Tax=Flavobacterium frigidimaris TaxID=262320 RepID=UPI00089623E3|nr:hypothetical protein [Flavobacterium frigidimaris]SDY82111.1 hypothetical protein SAMN05444397_102339 [Flavobacterium aquidurense]